MSDITTNQGHWSNPKNWNGFLYFCKEDSRLLVPKRIKWMGWTVNLGHKFAIIPVIAPIVILTAVICKLKYFSKD